MGFPNKNNLLFLPRDFLPKKEMVQRIDCRENGDLVLTYQTRKGVKVEILEEENQIKYCLTEPDITDGELEQLYTMIAIEQETHPTIDDTRLLYYYEKTMSGAGPLYPLLTDEKIEEIALNNPDTTLVIIHREIPHGWIDTNVYITQETANLIAKNLAKKTGKPLSPAFPFAEGVLPEGHRIAVTLGNEVSRKGTSFVIRLAKRIPYSLPQLVRKNTLSPLMAAYLWFLAEKQGFLMIIGGMASGKTTLMQSILNMLPDNHRVVTIEDTPELQLIIKNWDPLITRQVYSRGAEAQEIGLYELSKFALRRRAEHLVIGETRGEEARILAQASATGHGSLSTFHADTVRSALFRLMSDPISLKPGFTGLIWAFIQLKAVRPGERKVVKIIETVPKGPNKFSLIRIFRWDPEKDLFQPDTVEELVKKSYRLREIAETQGVMLEELIEEIAERTELISSLARRGVSSYELREYLRGFYRVKQGQSH